MFIFHEKIDILEQKKFSEIGGWGVGGCLLTIFPKILQKLFYFFRITSFPTVFIMDGGTFFKIHRIIYTLRLSCHLLTLFTLIFRKTPCKQEMSK